MKKKTNFDRYLEEQLKDPSFASRFERAGEAWDVALQIALLRQKAGLSQKELAKILKTSQQQISRLESPGYEGHSLSMLRRVAEALHAHVRVVFEPVETETEMRVAESSPLYQERLKKEFYQLQGYWSRKAREKGILSEKDLEKYLKK